MCSPMDKLKMTWEIESLLKLQNDLGCSEFRYHSKECGYVLKEGEKPIEQATTKGYQKINKHNH